MYNDLEFRRRLGDATTGGNNSNQDAEIPMETATLIKTGSNASTAWTRSKSSSIKQIQNNMTNCRFNSAFNTVEDLEVFRSAHHIPS